jgi:hypothetical protein
MPVDFDDRTVEVLEAVQPFTLTSAERVAALIEAVRYVVRHGIPGDLVECGVWRGGSAMAMALTLLGCGERHRDIYLYDTYTGMTEPDDADVSHRGEAARDLYLQKPATDDVVDWCYASIDEVQHNLGTTGYPAERIHFVKGPVEETIPGVMPDRIAILRLDTDWYASTRHELRYLFPRLVKNGVLIIDDYGHWQGARKAVDEYLGQERPCLLLCRVDYTGRIAIKTDDSGSEAG